MISQEEKEKIIRQLSERIPDIKCPMCGNDHFIIADGYFYPFMQDSVSSIGSKGPVVPIIPIICNKCGFVSQHAMGILGLLPDNQTNEEKGGNNGEH